MRVRKEPCVVPSAASEGIQMRLMRIVNETVNQAVKQWSENVQKLFPDSYLGCKGCGRRAKTSVWRENLYVCPFCGQYRAMTSRERFRAVLDEGSAEELDRGLQGSDPLRFPGYREKLKAAEKKTGLTESAVTMQGTIGGVPAVVAVMDSRFFMGSMSTAVGERITRAVEYADEHRLPLIIFCASGGARMQEGIYSLMQMAKTSAAVQAFSDHGGLYISYLTHPTTGGVTASFASLGDITLAEPGAMVGFAGPRVIEQTIGQKLPDDFQRSEYLEQHGFIDRIVAREEMKDTLTDILKLHAKPKSAYL